MSDQKIGIFLGQEGITLSEAMRQISENANGILFLVDKNGRLRASLTDGDIRRFLLAGGEIEDAAEKAANFSPKAARSMEEAQSLYHSKNYIMIPILDEKDVIVGLYNGDGTMQREKGSLQIPVVVNAGGRGTRLDPFTRVLPKPLIPVGDLPIIEHIMREFQTYDCNEFHIITNYKKELIKAYFSEVERQYTISWYDELQPLGTGGGLCLLKGKLDQTFFFTNCDNLLTANYERILEFHRSNQNAITMICAYKSFTVPYGVVKIGRNGAIRSMEEKPSKHYLTNTGIYIVEPEVLQDIEDNVPIGFPDIVDRQREKGRRVAVFPVNENEWMDMGQHSELEKMRTKLYGNTDCP